MREEGRRCCQELAFWGLGEVVSRARRSLVSVLSCALPWGQSRISRGLLPPPAGQEGSRPWMEVHAREPWASCVGENPSRFPLLIPPLLSIPADDTERHKWVLVRKIMEGR